MEIWWGWIIHIFPLPCKPSENRWFCWGNQVKEGSNLTQWRPRGRNPRHHALLASPPHPLHSLPPFSSPPSPIYLDVEHNKCDLDLEQQGRPGSWVRVYLLATHPTTGDSADGHSRAHSDSKDGLSQREDCFLPGIVITTPDPHIIWSLISFDSSYHLIPHIIWLLISFGSSCHLIPPIIWSLIAFDFLDHISQITFLRSHFLDHIS